MSPEQQANQRVLRGVGKAYSRHGIAGLLAYGCYCTRHGKDSADVMAAIEQAAERAVARAFAAGIEVAFQAGQQSRNQAE